MAPLGRHLIPLFLLWVLLGGCSVFGKRRPVGEAPSTAVDGTSVPKVQYDQLLEKYEKLLKEMRKQDDVAGPKEEVAASPPKEILTETVSVLETKPLAEVPPVVAEEAPAAGPADDLKTESEVLLLVSAVQLLKKEKYPEAMKILQKLESSPTRQIKVRAKFHIGELLVQQKEYDLAMQVFEEVIGSHAFSGIVLPSLHYLVLCSDKLKQESKLVKYTSMLKDIFEEI